MFGTNPYPPKDPRVGSNLTYAEDGMPVWGPVAEGRWRTGVVTCAAGNHARVKFPKVGDHLPFEGWYHVADLFHRLPGPPAPVVDAQPTNV